MSVAIRLRRQGALKRPYYKIIVTDQRAKRDGKFIEVLGSYDPLKPGANYAVDLERAAYWIGCGAQPSETVASIIKKAKKAAKSVEDAVPTS